MSRLVNYKKSRKDDNRYSTFGNEGESEAPTSSPRKFRFGKKRVGKLLKKPRKPIKPDMMEPLSEPANSLEKAAPVNAQSPEPTADGKFNQTKLKTFSCWKCTLCPLKCFCKIYRKLLPCCCACRCKQRKKYSTCRNRFISAWNGYDDDDEEEDIDKKMEQIKYEMRIQELNHGVPVPTPQGTSSLQRAKNRFWNWNDSIRSNNDKFLECLEFDDLSNAGSWRKGRKISRVQLTAACRSEGSLNIDEISHGICMTPVSL